MEKKNLPLPFSVLFSFKVDAILLLVCGTF